MPDRGPTNFKALQTSKATDPQTVVEVAEAKVISTNTSDESKMSAKTLPRSRFHSDSEIAKSTASAFRNNDPPEDTTALGSLN
jgi:hypothetical protein